MSELENLTKRVAQLEMLNEHLIWERQLYIRAKNRFRVLAFFSVTILVMIVTGMVGFTTSGVKDSIRARRIEVVDMAGQTRGVLEPDGIRWVGLHSHGAISIAPSGGLYIADYDGDTIAHLGGAFGGSLHLRSSENRSSVSMSAGVLQEMGGSISVQDENGDDIVRLPPEPTTN